MTTSDTFKMYIFRNCYTTGLAGGDVHSTGIYNWINNNTKNDVYCVRPDSDGQERAYPGLKEISHIAYSDKFTSSNTSIIFIVRSFYACFCIKLPSSQNDLYIASSHFMPDVIPVLFHSRKVNKNVRVVYIHHIIQDMNRKKSINNTLALFQERIMFRLIRKSFGNIIVVNRDVKKRLIERGFVAKHILISNNFIPTRTLLSYIKPYEDKKIDIVFCGRLMTQKGVYDFLNVVKVLQSKIPHFKAVMIGDGPESVQIAKVVTAEKLNVELKGFIEEDFKKKIISDSKVMVFPSIEEGWGIVVGEALALGTATIVYDLAVYKDIFEDVIFKAPIGSIDALISMYENIISEAEADDQYYKNLQVTGARFIRKYDQGETASNQLKFITEAKND